MAADARKRQKKQERRARIRKEKKHALVRQQSLGLVERLTDAARYPVLHCWITQTLWTEGIGFVILSRQLPGGRVAVADFLVDRYCLGVKDSFGEILGRSDYGEVYVNKMRGTMPARDVAPADARKLLHEAVAYARAIGLAPHRDYSKALVLFGDIALAHGTAEFEFGKDGQPCFVAGPNDTPGRCRQVLAILNDSCGPGGFRYVTPMDASGSGAYLLTPEDENGLRLAEGDEDEEVLGELEEFDDDSN